MTVTIRNHRGAWGFYLPTETTQPDDCLAWRLLALSVVRQAEKDAAHGDEGARHFLTRHDSLWHAWLGGIR